jgi:quercetin dioxygenase-like cupin family protein
VEEVYMKTTRTLVLAVLIVGGGLAVNVAQSQQPGVTRTDLLRHDLSVPEREVIQVRVDLAPGVAFPPHSHPGEEIAYVIEGLLEYRLEGKPPVTLKAGEALFIPAGTIHSAKNVGSGNAAELATYIVEKGKPLVALGQVSAR